MQHDPAGRGSPGGGQDSGVIPPRHCTGIDDLTVFRDGREKADFTPPGTRDLAAHPFRRFPEREPSRKEP